MYFHHIKSRVLPALLLTFLASCSTKPVSESPIQAQVPTEIEEVDVGALSAEQHIALAKTLETNSAVDELLIATKLFYQQKNYSKALWLADKTLPLIDENVINAIQEKIQLVQIKASSLQQLGYYPESHLQLKQLEQYADENKLRLSAIYYRLLSAAFYEKKTAYTCFKCSIIGFFSNAA